jgi:hypothetical protein
VQGAQNPIAATQAAPAQIIIHALGGPSETTPVVLADAGVENVNAQVDELIATGVLRRSWRSRP